MLEQLSYFAILNIYNGNFAGVPGSRGYFLGVGSSFKHMITVRCPCGLCDSTVLKKKVVKFYSLRNITGASEQPWYNISMWTVHLLDILLAVYYKLARNGFLAVVACCLQARKSLFRLSSLSPFWLISFFLRASVWFAPCCVAFCDPPLQSAFFG